MTTFKIPPTLQPNSICINGKVFVKKTGNEPVLKLTAKEKQEIGVLRNSISILEHELYNMSKYYSFNIDAINKRNNRDNSFLKKQFEIDSCMNQIEEIKKNRYKKQVEALSNK